MEKTYKDLVKGIKQYFKQANIRTAVIGLSGGIDSALSLRLVADAIGNNNVVALLMPERGLSKKANVDDAINLCNILNVNYKIIPINRFLRAFKELPWDINKIAQTNTKSRIRAVILYNYANTHNSLVIGTSNKTELILGYFTKYGDGAVDIEVIGSLYKTEVFKLAKYLKLPDNIISKTPTAELFHGHTDEKEIGASYDTIDNILKKKLTKGIAVKIRQRIKKNQHKKDILIIK